MKEMINVICLYWMGDFRGRDFHASDVNRLYRSVEKNIDRPFKFYCLTNNSGAEFAIPEYTKIPLRHNFPGWWSKMELHRPDLPIKGRTLYLDLDTHVVGNLQPILDHPGDLVMFDNRVPVGTSPKLRGVVRKYQAATMLFDPSTLVMAEVWYKFISNPNRWMKKYRSDQDVMGDWIPDQKTFPKVWMMKMKECRTRDQLPDECILVTGQPFDMSFRDVDKLPWFVFNQIAV